MSYDVIVIGTGPAGYVCAIRCAQLGLKTAVVEKRTVGGVCLNVGCIPSKAMINAGKTIKKIKSADVMGIEVDTPKLHIDKLVAWKDGIVSKLTGGVAGLLKSHKVTMHKGTAKLVSNTKVEVKSADGTEVIEAKNIVLAQGSSPIEIPGFAFDGDNVWSSTEALAPKELPKRLLVIGGGVIGLELGLAYYNMGSELRVVEFMDKVLPGIDAELSKEMGRSLKKRKIATHLKAKAKSYKKTKTGLEVTVEINGKDQVFECDKILSSVGRRPNGKGTMGMEEVGVALDERGFVTVDAQRRTNIPNIYAIGDCAGQPMLAHKGSHEGLAAAAAIAGQPGAAYDPACIPGVIYTNPEVATVGLSAEEAKAAGFDPVEGKFPFGASGRAMSVNETEGWVKIVADKNTDKILGLHLIGPDVTELVAEGCLAIELGATAEDLAATIHAHPTLSECTMEAAESVHNMAVHIFQKPTKK